MKTHAFALGVVAFAIAAAGLYAIERCAAARASRQTYEELRRQLETSARLSAQYPQAFGAHGTRFKRDEVLKTLVQEMATNRDVTIGYLSESERDIEKGRRERQVIVRLVNAGHANLVHFLQDLESHGGGAKVKEIHVRPSREIPEAYEEAEIVLSKVSATEKGP